MYKERKKQTRDEYAKQTGDKRKKMFNQPAYFKVFSIQCRDYCCFFRV